MAADPAAQATINYAGYLRLDELLTAQHPASPAALGDHVRAAEHFFIVTHQAFELWFKQELLDLGCATRALAAPTYDAELALDHLHRVGSIQRLLYQQMALFGHLSPAAFLAFRPYLGTASGSESAQFRQVQRALGLRGGGAGALCDAFTAALDHAGLTLEEVYRDLSRAGVFYRLAEELVDISEGFWLLTAAHVRVAERTIGQKPGTGGTSGVEYLAEALKVKAFPELWAVRTRL